jgi:hypothetical protein
MKFNRFARKGCDISFTSIKNRTILKAPILHRINFGLQKLATMNIILRIINIIRDIVNEYVKKQGS